MLPYVVLLDENNTIYPLKITIMNMEIKTKPWKEFINLCEHSLCAQINAGERLAYTLMRVQCSPGLR